MFVLKPIQRAINFLIFTNLLIAFAAVAQCLLTYIILAKEPNWYILFVEGGSTLVLYNVSLLLSRPKKPLNSPYERTRWVFTHMFYFWFLSGIALFVLCYSIFQLHVFTFLFLIFIGFLSLLYGLPIFTFKGKKVGFRQIPGLKVFHIAILWSLSGVGLPIIELWTSGEQIDWSIANYLGLVKILFLLICTLPFDVRDMEQDKLYQLKTIPNIIGKNNTIRLCYTLLVTHSLLIYFAPYTTVVIWGLLMTNVVVLFVYKGIVFSNKKSQKSVYAFDFILILQCIFVLLIDVFFNNKFL